MNWTLFTGVCLIMAGLICSAELFRRGFLADNQEIKRRKKRGDNSNRLLLLMIVFAVVGYMVATGGLK